MKTLKPLLFFVFVLIMFSCKPKDKSLLKQLPGKEPALSEIILPIDKGFSQYITAYTSGIVPAFPTAMMMPTPLVFE